MLKWIMEDLATLVALGLLVAVIISGGAIVYDKTHPRETPRHEVRLCSVQPGPLCQLGQ